MENNNKINQLLKEAFNLDSQKRYPEAYLKYITCLNEINKFLIKPDTTEEVLKKLFSLSKQCLERSETIRFLDDFIPRDDENQFVQQSYSSQPNHYSSLLREERKEQFDPFEEKKKQLEIQNQLLKSRMSQSPNDVKQKKNETKKIFFFFFLKVEINEEIFRKCRNSKFSR